MKTVIDYLKEHGKFETGISQYREGKIKNFTVLIELKKDKIHVKCKDDNSCIEETIDINDDVEHAISDILKAYKLEIRFCEECGKPYDAGYTVDGGFWYCCEDCFESTMDRDYGKGKWRGTDKEGEWGGFYEALNEFDEWQDTGIYYTEWN